MRDPRHQICSNCGTMLEIKRCDGNQFKNCSSTITGKFPIKPEKDIFFRNQKTDNDPNNQ
jgi:hypothetical protein